VSWLFCASNSSFILFICLEKCNWIWWLTDEGRCGTYNWPCCCDSEHV
jgi:hypothetical protein